MSFNVLNTNKRGRMQREFNFNTENNLCVSVTNFKKFFDKFQENKIETKYFSNKNLKESFNTNSNENLMKFSTQISYDNDSLAFYTLKNTPLHNSSIKLNFGNSQLLDNKEKEIPSVNFKSKFLNQKQKQNYTFDNTNKLIIEKVNDILIRPEKERDYSPFDIEEDLIDRILNFKHKSPQFKKLNFNNIKENANEDEEINFSISDISINYEANKMFEYVAERTPKESNKKIYKISSNKKYKEENEETPNNKNNLFRNNNKFFNHNREVEKTPPTSVGIKKNLKFSEILNFDTEEVVNKNNFNVGNSTFNLLKNTNEIKKQEEEIQLNDFDKQNTEFSLSVNMNNSQSVTSKKRVTFTDDTSVYSFDNSKIIPKLRKSINSLKFGKNKKKNIKLKSILVKGGRDSSRDLMTSDGEVTSGYESMALERLNKLIKECELEENLIPTDKSKSIMAKKIIPPVQKTNLIKNRSLPCKKF